MSFIRPGWPYRYVEGTGNDYIFEDIDGFVQDYGSCSDNTLVELLCKQLDHSLEDGLYKDYLMKKLSESLGVVLRESPLTFDEMCDLMQEQVDNENDKRGF